MQNKLFYTALFSLMMTVAFGQDTINSIGLIGTATPFGWDADTNMTKVDTVPHLWSIDVTLTDGLAKFRANDDWDINWGGEDFPTGIGTQGGPDINVFAGDYHVTLNDSTGEYNFAVESAIGILGDATPNGWDSDHNMWEDTNGVFFITLDLTVGKCKFRQDDLWDINWGAVDFPMGVGTQGGPDIEVSKAGRYFITFDTTSGAYNFEEIILLDSVMIVGSATEGGWEMGTLMMQDASDPSKWTLATTLTDGGAQFTANGGELVWGGSGFPMDTAVLGGDTIPVVAGDYLIEVNTETGVYNFLVIENFETIGIIGDAVNGWDMDDVDMERDPADSSQWSLRIELTDGEAKFRANDSWEDPNPNWGSGEFPSGIATRGGPNIPITGGEYIIDFNSITGAYNFELVVEYDAVSLVGKSGPAGDWPGEDASNDLFLAKSPDDPNIWTVDSVELTDHMGADDEGVKFRADTAWTVNWGAADFPTGIGEQDGDNIVTVAGTYDVVFNSATGEYAFNPPGTVSNRIVLKPSEIKVFPNPTEGRLNIDLTKLEFRGDYQVIVMDMSGKQLINRKESANDQLRLDVSSLNMGNYVLQIIGGGYIIGKKFSVVK